jgi:hypothetical protein
MLLCALIYCIEQLLISIVAIITSLLELDKIHPNAIEWSCSCILRHTPANKLVKLCLDANLAILPQR